MLLGLRDRAEVLLWVSLVQLVEPRVRALQFSPPTRALKALLQGNVRGTNLKRFRARVRH